jgi:hypothetical protein
MKKFGIAPKVAFLLLALVLPAAAGKPTITLAPFTGFFLSAAQGCGTFDVNFTPEAGRPNGGRLISFSDGDFIIQGPTFITATNQSNGHSINHTIGPGHFLLTPNTFAAYGGQFNALPAALAEAAGLPAVSLSTGRLVLTFDASGNLVSVSFTGNADDLCQLLQ